MHFAHFTSGSYNRFVIISTEEVDTSKFHVTSHIDSGSYRFNFMFDRMEKFISARGVEKLTVVARFTSIADPDLVEIMKNTPETFIDRFTTVWPIPSSNEIVQVNVWVDGEKMGWGFFDEMLGLKFRPGGSAGMSTSPKWAKRRMEIFRESAHWTSDELEVAVIETADLGDFFAGANITGHMLDGCSIIRMSTALKMADNIWDPSLRLSARHDISHGKIKRVGTLRGLTPGGLIKGDGIILPDGFIDQQWAEFGAFDIITSSENVKPELATTEGQFWTFDVKKATGEVFWDFQSRSWMNDAFDTVTDVKAVITKGFDDTLDAVKAGEIPEWLGWDPTRYFTPKSRIDGHGNPRRSHDSETMESSFLRLAAAGIDPRACASVTSLMVQGLNHQVASRLAVREPDFDEANAGISGPLATRPNGAGRGSQVFAPMPWACYGYGVTTEIPMALGGLWEFADRDAREIFFSQKVDSIVIPGWMGQHYSDNFGGHDYDDRFIVALRRFVMPDGELTDEEAHGVSIVQNFIPDIADGDLVGVIWRQPNIPGEYVIAKVDSNSFTWYNTSAHPDGPPVINLDQVPTPVHMLEPTTSELEVPVPSFAYTDVYDIAAAAHSCQVAMAGLNVGRFMNWLMLGTSMGFRVDTPVGAEWVVDTCQASPFIEAVPFLDQVVAEMRNQVLEMAGKTRPDGSAYRCDKLLADVKLPTRDLGAVPKRNGFFTIIWHHAEAERKRFAAKGKTLGFQLRARHRLHFSRAITFSPKATALAKFWVDTYLDHSRDLARAAEADPTTSPYRELSGYLAGELLARVNGDIELLFESVLAMYVELIKPRHKSPFGVGDNMLFGPPPADHIGMLDLFLMAMSHAGFADGVWFMRTNPHAEAPILMDRLGNEVDLNDPAGFFKLYLNKTANAAPAPMLGDVTIIYRGDDSAGALERVSQAWSGGVELVRMAALMPRTKVSG